MSDFDFVDYLHAFADDANRCTMSASASIRRCAEELARLAEAESRLAAAEARVEAVKATCDRHEHGALRWEEPLPVPSWIGEVRAALSGEAS